MPRREYECLRPWFEMNFCETILRNRVVVLRGEPSLQEHNEMQPLNTRLRPPEDKTPRSQEAATWVSLPWFPSK